MARVDKPREEPHARMVRLREKFGRIPTFKEWLLDAGIDEATATVGDEVLRKVARDLLAELRAE